MEKMPSPNVQRSKKQFINSYTSNIKNVRIFVAVEVASESFSEQPVLGN
jgi:hypothetical protein